MRFFASTLLGILVALLLFLLMHSLISGRSTVERDADSSVRLDFIKVNQDEIENLKKRAPPPKPEPPKKPPPPPKMTVNEADRPTQNMPQIEMPKVSLGVSAGSGPYLGNWSAGDPAAEGDVIPIVRIEPQFPREALIKGIAGWVEIEFTIEPDGTVSKPRVIASEPPRIFDRNAIRAIYKWKFKPRIVDGQPVARQATQRLDFNLNQ
jgi:protein TonB